MDLYQSFGNVRISKHDHGDQVLSLLFAHQIRLVFVLNCVRVIICRFAYPYFPHLLSNIHDCTRIYNI